MDAAFGGTAITARGMDGSSTTHHPARRVDQLSLRVIIMLSDDDQARIQRALEIWKQSVDPTGTLVEKHLASRKLGLSDGIRGCVLRFHKACSWLNDDTDELSHVPAMIAAMRDAGTNELRAIQITAFRSDGSKIGRKTRGVTTGTAIKLSPDDSVEYGLTIGEGTETVLAGMKLGYAPAWACGSASNLRGFPVLPGIDALTILVDHDEVGQRAAAECAQRWIAAGIEVFRHVPRNVGQDFNDIVRGALHENR
jgi:putative DNA primase/helicase